jgi:peptide deformylase
MPEPPPDTSPPDDSDCAPTPAPAAIDPAALRIVFHPDPVLRQPARPLPEIDDSVRAVARRMIELMHEARGVGLAAPQVGLSWRMFIANPTAEPGAEQVFINPTLRDPAAATEARDEGCLSLPGITAEITRPAGITIDALDLESQPFSLTSDDFPARVWQHEFDHLEGVLLLDKMTRVDRMANRRAIAELEE